MFFLEGGWGLLFVFLRMAGPLLEALAQSSLVVLL